MAHETDTLTHEAEPQQEQSNSMNTLVGGMVLIGLGSLFLLAQFLEVGLLVLPILAIVFIAAGILARSSGWFIPGGILAGIALGSTVTQLASLPEDAEGGVFLLCFALGWVSITVLTKLFTQEDQRWALIPALIMALIGGAVLAGEAGRTMLGITFSIANYIWPVILIGIGLYLIVRHRRNRDVPHAE